MGDDRAGRPAEDARPPSRRAEEILDEAMRLFAERGYATTSVADIQLAAGMTGGSGALYKHFPSKQALFEAGIERFIAEGNAAASVLPDPAKADLETMLCEVGARVLQTLAEDRAALRLAWRDLPAFPELNRRFLDARLQFGFAQLASWLAELDDAGRADIEDPAASAAVLLSPLAFFGIMDAMLGEKPAHVSDSRFLQAWVRFAARALAPSDPPTGPQAQS